MKTKQTLLALVTLIMATAFFSCSMDMPGVESLSESADSRSSASACPEQQNYCLIVDYWAKSSADGDVRKSTPTGTYKAGTEITAVAEPCLAQNGYFAGWYDAKYEGNLVSKEATYSFKLTANTKLYARFDRESKPAPVYIDLTTDSNGNIAGFPDPVLDRVIREKLGKPEGPLNKTELATIKYLGYNSGEGRESITNLRGIELLTELITLNLSHNKINSFLPLSRLTKVTNLSLEHCELEDISFIKSMINLDSIRLANNRIKDVTPLEGLTKLTRVIMHNNKIEKITALQTLTNMSVISLSDNPICDLSPISSMRYLIQIDMDNTMVSDLRPLAGLGQLMVLKMEGCRISDLTPLKGLNNLRGLYLNKNQIKDISTLKTLPVLTILRLENNLISDLTPLAENSWLGSLDLSGNKIEDLEPLRGKKHITHLTLSNNKLKDISVLSSLTELRGVELSHNKISDLTPLKGLTTIGYLFLENNRIADISPLLENSGIGSNDRIYLTDNPNIPAEQIEQLKNKGVKLTF